MVVDQTVHEIRTVKWKQKRGKWWWGWGRGGNKAITDTKSNS